MLFSCSLVKKDIVFYSVSSIAGLFVLETEKAAAAAAELLRTWTKVPRYRKFHGDCRVRPYITGSNLFIYCRPCAENDLDPCWTGGARTYCVHIAGTSTVMSAMLKHEYRLSHYDSR